MPTATARKRDAASGTLARHRQATHEYEILETFEAGIELHGTEVKSLRGGRTQLRDGYVRVENGQAWLLQVHISPYEKGNVNNHEPERRRRLLLFGAHITPLISASTHITPDPTRTRKLLLHAEEIKKLIGKVERAGYTLVPINLHFTKGRIKLEIGLARGKKLWDKRQSLAEADARRDVERMTRAAMR